MVYFTVLFFFMINFLKGNFEILKKIIENLIISLMKAKSLRPWLPLTELGQFEKKYFRLFIPYVRQISHALLKLIKRGKLYGQSV